MGDYKSSLTAFKNSQTLKDSIFSTENQKKIAEIEAKKDLEIQQKENERLKSDSALKFTDLILKQKQLSLLSSQQMLQKLDLDKKNLLINSKNNELSLLEKDKKLNELSLKEKEAENDKNAKALKLKEFEVTQARNERFALFGGLAFLFLVLLFVYRERNRSEKLLLNILPKSIATRLKKKEHPIADHFDEASVVFIDIEKFTEKSANTEPKRIVEILNILYSKLDFLSKKHGLEKIKTIGDCYMAASGIPISDPENVIKAAKFSLEAMNILKDYVIGDGTILSFRCGVDCGPVVAGVIGDHKFIYDLWGDTVNTASRMESNGNAGKIHVTERFKSLVISRQSLDEVNSQFKFIERGEIEIKGKGMMRTYFLV
jgi:class 3 adenylate cyclase